MSVAPLNRGSIDLLLCCLLGENEGKRAEIARVSRCSLAAVPRIWRIQSMRMAAGLAEK